AQSSVPGPTGCRPTGSADGGVSQRFRPTVGSADGDAVDRGLGLGAQLVRDRGGARVLGGDVLALGGDDVAGVGLHGLALGGVGVGAAQREVGDQHDRVDARLGGGAVQLHDDVVLLAALLARGDVHGLRGSVGAVLDELLAHLDRGGAEVAGRL